MRKLLFTLSIAIVCGIICSSCKDANRKPNETESAFHTGHNIDDLSVFFDSISSQFMGSVMITQGDSVIFSKNTGFIDIENKVPITDTTPFRIGSITKSFTGILTLKTIEAGKISMDDKLSKFFPDANITNADSITIYHLLHHRSGLQDFINETYQEFQSYMLEPQTKEQMLERFGKLKSNFPVGQKFSYSNTGYILLAYILEQVNAKSYAEQIQEEIAQPLGLTGTFCSSGQSTNTNSYEYKEGWVKREPWHPSVCVGTGSIVSTTQDLQKYIYAIANGFWGEYVTSQMLDFVEGYGCGVGGIKGEDGKLIITHTGSLERYLAYMNYEDGTVTTLLQNTMETKIETLIWTMNCAQKGEVFPIPDLNYIALDSAQINEYIGEFTCENHKLTFSNNGKHLIATDENNFSVTLNAKPNGAFQFYGYDIEIYFNQTKDSLKYRIGPENRMYTKVK